jgi:hypothetical protein
MYVTLDQATVNQLEDWSRRAAAHKYAEGQEPLPWESIACRMVEAALLIAQSNPGYREDLLVYLAGATGAGVA